MAAVKRTLRMGEESAAMGNATNNVLRQQTERMHQTAEQLEVL